MHTKILDAQKKIGSIVMKGEVSGYSLLLKGMKELLQNGIIRVILDLSQVHFVSSSAIGEIVASNQDIEAQQGRFVILCQHPRLINEFHQTHVDQLIPIFHTQDEAFQALSV